MSGSWKCVPTKDKLEKNLPHNTNKVSAHGTQYDDLQSIPINKGKNRNHKTQLARNRRNSQKLEKAKRGLPLYKKWVTFSKRENGQIPRIDEALLHKIGVTTKRDKRVILFVQDIENIDQMIAENVDIIKVYARALGIE